MFNDYSWERHLAGERQIGYEDGIKVGERRGERRGEKRGERRGEKRIVDLTKILLETGRTSDLERATIDKKYRQKLMRQLGVMK